MEYRYQVGVDGGSSYSNAAGSTTINVTNATGLTGSTLSPWIHNNTDNPLAGIWHFADLSSVTSTAITVSPAIPSANASLRIFWNGPQFLTGSSSGSMGFLMYGSSSLGLKPIGCKQSEQDPSLYALTTDTELTLSGNILVSNVKVYSTDGTSSSLKYGKVSSDGTVFVTSSDAYPVWVASVTGSSCSTPTYAALASVWGNSCATASIDPSGDLHVYDSRVSGSVDALNGYLLNISSSTVNTTNAVLAASSSTAASTTATYAASSSVVNGFAENFNENRINILYSMFPYQLGIDGGTFNNAAGGTVVSVYGTTAITGSSICPWVYNASDQIFHQVTTSTVTTSSFVVSPAIPTISASLVIRFNKAKLGYNSAVDGYQVLNLNPPASHINGPALFVSESNGSTGITSSDLSCVTYRYATIQGRLANVSCSLSATLSDEATPDFRDWYPVSYILTGSTADYFTGSFIYTVGSDNNRYTKIRVNYFKTSTSNASVFRVILHGSE